MKNVIIVVVILSAGVLLSPGWTALFKLYLIEQNSKDAWERADSKSRMRRLCMGVGLSAVAMIVSVFLKEYARDYIGQTAGPIPLYTLAAGLLITAAASIGDRPFYFLRRDRNEIRKQNLS